MKTLHRYAALLGIALACTGALAQVPAAAANCPPQAQAPTPQQLQAAQRNARDRGVLWRLMRDGATSYLFGTLHVGKLEWAFPGPAVQAALAATDTIALELDPMDPQVQGAMQSASAQRKLVPSAALAAKLERGRARACVPAEALAALHPVLQATTLVLLEAAREGLQPAYGQEIVLVGTAASLGRKVVSLESAQTQIDAIIPREPREAERVVDSMLDQLNNGSSGRVMARMAAAWAQGDLATLADYERWCDCVASEEDRAFLRRVNDDRNPALAERIDALHREGRKVFAGIGALHMVGPKGLPALLRGRGFVVERVAFQ
jgi:uncharacterized protein